MDYTVSDVVWLLYLPRCRSRCRIRCIYLFIYLFRTHLLPSFCTSRGHRCRPFSPPVLAFNFLSRIGFSNPTARRFFHRVLLTHAFALSARHFVQKKKSPRFYTSMHSGEFELTKLTYTRLEDNLARHRGDRMYMLCCCSTTSQECTHISVDALLILRLQQLWTVLCRSRHELLIV